MATLREYFDTDSRALSFFADFECRTREGALLAAVRGNIAHDFEANAKYWYFFVPENADPCGCVNSILALSETAECALPASKGTEFQVRRWGYSERQTSATLVFTRRVIFYIDAQLGHETRRTLSELGNQRGFHITVRDREYAAKRMEHEKPLAFISHDSRDKDALVRELAHEMVKLLCPVWYDEFSLKVGDSLRTNIEKGLKEARKCIVVLSPNFLSNGGWSKAEFDSIFTREIVEQANVVLPVWHNVSKQDVYDYSPRLADKMGLSSSLGVPELARRLSNVLRAGI